MQLWPSIKYADIFLRPSYTDGDSNAIRESISLNTFSVASDVVERPKDVIIYPSGNVNELSKIIVDYYFGYKHYSSFSELNDGFEKMKNLIYSLLQE